MVSLVIVRGAVPEFVTVTVFAAVEVPMVVEAKTKEEAPRVTTGAARATPGPDIVVV